MEGRCLNVGEGYPGIDPVELTSGNLIIHLGL